MLKEARRRARISARMQIVAKRTLMKSAPELWGLLDDEPQLRYWTSHLCGDDEEVEVIARKRGRLLAWRSEGAISAVFEVTLAEKGFGTKVEISAEADERLRRDALEQVLDDLAEPQRRPFSAV
jgi:hypothetical protein